MRHPFDTKEVIEFLSGGQPINGHLQNALLNDKLSAAQLRRSRDICVAELIHNQYPNLALATDPELRKHTVRFCLWSNSEVSRSPVTWVSPFVPARNFPLRHILFVVFDRSFVLDGDPQKVHDLMEFLLDVPNEQSFASQGRRHQAREALLLRLPQLRDIQAPHPPMTRTEQEPWFYEQELRFGTTQLVTALPPKAAKAPTPASSDSDTSSLIRMHHYRVGAY